MRAMRTSSMNAATVRHSRTAPPAVGLLEESTGAGLAPSSASITAPSAPDDTQCAHGYSGCIGVLMKGVQPASAASALLPPPWRTAVTGRQKLYVYLASKTAMSASSTATVPTA